MHRIAGFSSGISRLLFAVLTIGLVVTVAAAQSPQTEYIRKLFQQGIEDYNRQSYQQALQHFQQVQAQSGFNPLTTANHLMMVKTYHQLGLNRQSVQQGKDFLRSYPTSSYRDHIYFTMAEAYLELGEYANSVRYCVRTIEHSPKDALDHAALEFLLKTTDIYMNIEEVQALVDGTVDSGEEQIYQLALLQEYIQTGEMSLASTTSMELEEVQLQPLLQPTFRAMRKAISLDMERQLAIGVIVPLSGPSKDIGREILGGARFALARADDLPQVSIIPLNNAGKALKTVQKYNQAVRHNRMVAMIGPVFSQNVIASAALAGINQMPLISPTATSNGLAALNEYIFQLSPDYETRGKGTAQFAVDSLNLQTFAVVSPVSEQGKALTDAFTAEVESRGGEVISQVWYSKDDQDLGDQFEHLRKVGFKLRADRMGPVDTSKIVSDSLRATMSDSQFVELFRKRMEERAEKIDSAEIQLQGFDGMYFPMNSGDMNYIAPTFAFYNFDTQLLGNVQWYDQDKLHQWSTHIDSIYIFSDYYLAEDTPEGRSFIAEFRKEMNTSPTSLHLYGFEAMSLILQQIRDGVESKRALVDRLNSVHSIDGIGRSYTLNGSPPRVNQTLQVLQYTRRGLHRVDTLTIGPRKTHPFWDYFNP